MEERKKEEQLIVELVTIGNFDIEETYAFAIFPDLLSLTLAHEDIEKLREEDDYDCNDIVEIVRKYATKVVYDVDDTIVID